MLKNIISSFLGGCGSDTTTYGREYDPKQFEPRNKPIEESERDQSNEYKIETMKGPNQTGKE